MPQMWQYVKIAVNLHMLLVWILNMVYRMVIIGIIVLLVIPIYGLTGFHVVLVSRGRTTNEQVTGKFKGGYNPFSRGCPRNCCYILCGPQYPRLAYIIYKLYFNLWEVNRCWFTYTGLCAHHFVSLNIV